MRRAQLLVLAVVVVAVTASGASAESPAAPIVAYVTRDHIAVVGAGLSSIVNAIVVMMRGADSFGNMQAVQAAIPSLAMIVPATGKLAIFFATFTPFTIWATGLSIAAMLIIGRVPKLQAWLAGIVLFLVPSLIAVASAR